MRNPDLAEVNPEAAFVAAPEMALLMRSTFPDGPRRWPVGRLRRKYESIRAGTKNVAGLSKVAKIRRIKEMGSSLG